MIDDLESNMQIDNIESTSDKFPMIQSKLPGAQQDINILSMSTSKKNLYLVTDRGEILCIDSKTLTPIQQSFSISSSGSSGKSSFKENFTKIWTDRAGNHNIIRFGGKIFYFNLLCNYVKEIECFKNVEICAVGFNDRNENNKSTGLFLAADYDNNIYECKIQVEKKNNNEYNVLDAKQKLTTLVFKDWDTEEDEEYSEPKKVKYERIYGIKFFKTTKPKKDRTMNDNIYYIICATRTKFYQFTGPGEETFLQLFEKFNNNQMLFNDSCKYFPEIPRISKIFTGSDVDILYKSDERVDQFGWKTESGFCFGNFNFIDYLPHELYNFTVVPFEKINNRGKKESGLEPLSVTHTQNHIFVLYKDCLTIISKLTSNIIHTEYLQNEFTGIVYNEFAEENGVILLYSRNGLYQISLKDENKDIWQDYLDTGDYSNALKCVNDNTILTRRINRISADEDYENKDLLNSVMKYNLSDEKFEIVCLKYLMKDDIEALKLYCELYLNANVNIREKYYLEANLITTLIIEIMLNNKEEKKRALEVFRQFIRENLKYIKEGNIVYPLVKSYGKMDEFIEYASIIGDYETVIMYYINQGNISEALDKLITFASFADDKDTVMIDNLIKIFVNNSHAFFKYNPKESIDLIKQKFKDIPMEEIIQAIIFTMDKEDNLSYQSSSFNKNIKLAKKDDNSQVILKYLKFLIEKKNIKEESNIHNLYIYYLSKSKMHQEAIIEYLKGPLKSDESNIFSKKKKVLFQLDYAKKLFENNTPAYALVLALMGKYSEGVKKALSVKDKDCRKIAEFIASNAPGDSLKKQLWIEIFSCDNNQNEFQEALKIMKDSKILKIEDVLPHITDTIKIEDFKKQISECISDYEDNIKKLKEDINNYNKTAENIKNDIVNLKKRSMEIPYSSYKCVICQVYIKNKNIYLFPCGHMFDANCIRECLLNYEATGLDYIHEKNVRIDKLFLELGYIEKSSFESQKKIKKDMNRIEEEKNQSDFPGVASNIFKQFTKFKRQDNIDDKNVLKNEKRREAELELNAILSEQCVLCGDYMVDSIQCSVCKTTSFKQNDDGFKMRLDNISNWDYIDEKN